MGQDRIDTVYDFYEFLVKSSCTNYLKNNSNSLVASINACMAICHMSDWYIKEVNSDKQVFWDDVKNRCPEIDIARRLINAAKHGNNKKYDKVVFERAIEFQNDIHHDTEFPVNYVVAYIEDEQYDLRDIIKVGMDFWEQEIKKLPTEKDKYPEKFDDSIEAGDW